METAGYSMDAPPSITTAVCRERLEITTKRSSTAKKTHFSRKCDFLSPLFKLDCGAQMINGWAAQEKIWTNLKNDS